jgi:L-alanine-DL-glutamate epimerase-like enolase superfamily enzyme
LIIEKVKLYRLKVPLKRPYKIATAAMKDFDFTLVALQASGHEGLGEAMADLKGYFWETAEEVWQFARNQGGKLLGQTLRQAHENISSFRKEQPCATTPFLTAIEILSGFSALTPSAEPRAVPLVAILQATEREGIEREVKEFIANGYEIIKVKVGFEVDRDIEKVRAAQQVLQGKVKIRADANQGYTLPQARKFVENIDPQRIEFFEQPFPENEWEAMAELSKVTPVPLGLDESIYGMESVIKARQLGCAQFVKFKLMKIGSAEAMVENIEKSREYGFEVILGNGAAGEISCYHEALVASKTVIGAGEMNGFLKQGDSILIESLKINNGKILLEPNFSLKLDRQKVEKYIIDHTTFTH